MNPDTNQPTQERDVLASERTLLAAERTLSAWIRTGLAGVAGGLAITRALVFQEFTNRVVAHGVGSLLVIWGAGIFVYAFLNYHRTSLRLSEEGAPKTSLTALMLITVVLLVATTLVFWITLQ